MNGLTGEKKAVRQFSPGDAAGQLRSSITNVATLPKGVLKLTESFEKGAPRKENKMRIPHFLYLNGETA